MTRDRSVRVDSERQRNSRKLLRKHLGNVPEWLNIVANLDFGTVLEPMVEKPGDYAGSFRAATGEILVHHWNSNHTVGQKFVLSNAFQRHAGRATRKGTIVVSDEYKAMFSICDKFNRALHDRTWPHRHGGGTHVGDWNAVHDFYFSSTLQNVFNAWRCLNNIGRGQFQFRDGCIQLSNQLFAFSLTL